MTPGGVGVRSDGTPQDVMAWAVPSLCGLLLARALPCIVARTRALQKATRLSDDPQRYWQLPRRRLPSRAALVCRRHFRIFRQVADTSPPRAEGNHPNPCLSWRVRPLLMAQDDKDKIRYSETVFRSCPPGPNTWTLNIQPLGQFRPHRGFLLARSTLLSSVARLLHTAGCRAVPSLCGLLLARAQMPRRNPERPRFRGTVRFL